MTELALKELHATLRFLAGWGGAVLIVGILAFAYLHHTPPTAPSNTPSKGISTARKIEREVQGVLNADRLLAASRGSTPLFSAPAVNVVRELPGMRGFSGAEIASILGALKPATIEVVRAHLSALPIPSPTPPPGWTPAQQAALFATDKAATAAVLADPTTKIAVTVSRQEVAPTRVGSIFTANGAGLGYAAVRKGHFELELGAVLHGAHLSPVIAPSWLIPHTQLAIGLGIGYDRRVTIGAAATVHF